MSEHGNGARRRADEPVCTPEFAYILEDAGAKVCFVSDDLADGISEIAGDIVCLEHIVLAGSARYGDRAKRSSPLRLIGAIWLAVLPPARPVAPR